MLFRSPFGIDVGAFISAIPSTNIKLSGYELRYAIVDGGTVIPAVGIRYAATSLSGVDNYELSTRSLDLSVSKGFLMLTPYAGIGKVWTSSDIDSSVLSSVDFSQNKLYAGVNLNLGLLNIAVEADKTGDYGSYSAKLGFRF